MKVDVSMFQTYVETFQVSLKYENNNWYFKLKNSTFMIITHWILLIWKSFQTKLVEKSKTPVVFSNLLKIVWFMR
jgi:hypothetical protein